MPAVIPFFNGSKTTCIYALKPCCPNVEDLVDLLVCLSCWFENCGCLQSFILKSTHGNMVIWGGVWTTGCDIEKALDLVPSKVKSCLSSVEAFHKMLSPLAKILMAGWYDIYCGETRCGLPAAKISRGDVVTIRLIMTEPEKQGSLSYAFLAILKSFFLKTKGLSSFTCFKSHDGDKVVGLGVWDDSEPAYAWIFNSDHHSKIRAYLQGLILDTKYDIMEVVYATGDDPPLLLQTR